MSPPRRGRGRARGGANRKRASKAPLPDLAVAPDLEVTLSYRVFDAQGVLHDEVLRSAPLRYIHGYAQVIPGLESGLEGARRGERRTLVLEPDAAFGERDPSARFSIARDDFPSGNDIKVGDELVCSVPDEGECSYRVLEVTDEEIVADQNHPLAGQRVRFEVEVLVVRRVDDAALARAAAEMDERIEYADSIDYSGSEDEVEASGGFASDASLVQLRLNRKSGSRS